MVGSFLRPAELKAAREKFANHEIDHDELKNVEDKCIKELVEKEAQAGLHAVTDGEFRRSWWHLDTFWGFEGIAHTNPEHGYFFHGEETRADSAAVTGKVRFNGTHPDLEAFKYLKRLTDGTDLIPRQSIPAPAQCYEELVLGEGKNEAIAEFYSSKAELAKDVSQAYHDLILALYDAGCRDLKLDDCTWGSIADDEFWHVFAEDGQSRELLQEQLLKINNDALVNLPADLVVTTHVCRGNYHSTWATKGGYGPVADYVLAKENVAAFYLEYDSERAGGFEPLAKVPADKYVVLGLLTSKSGELEDRQVILDRIQEAAQYHDLDKLCLSTQCGFSSTEEGNILTEEQQWAKIALVKSIAEEVWGA
ncbi:5-methyltetrahydropteroyltriglutamate--homocysteine methyltransferase [Limosilactobacillus mucosae LM1]|uniref:5-methyltetrahydropteroyltriglutamate--homocysteine methyltransferase n=1 Tax=Limosilactobacillus mucosae LM1 TaxID=1130798 RepID=A0A0D4CNC4_LIMMU|nr:5-methyltetrahydropteroyltriglutamate--homocysteine methyltransferase [Limosilactobacillus mucosae LM1]